ncbi:MAG: hypothetical protein IMW97_05105 [Firmicutes bacterium]|nr:hypothetical protein [Candidatus Fermentithermobacillaceae bacterium]
MRGPIAAAVLLIDRILRKRHGIREFTTDPDCVLRVAVGRADREIRLSDGTKLESGDPVGEIHLWNERIPKMRRRGPDITWGLGFQRSLVKSLRLLADYVRASPEFDDVKAFRARPGVKGRDGEAKVARLAQRFGFEMPATTGTPSLLERLYRFFDNLYATGLMLTFNPVSLKGREFWCFSRPEIWISRKGLLERYGNSQNWQC